MFPVDPLYVTQLDVLRCFPPRGHIAVSARNFYALALCILGKGEYRTDNQSLCSPPGSVLFLPKNVGYTSIVNETREIIVCHFDIIGSLPSELRVILPPHDDTIIADFNRLLELYESPDPADHFACMSKFYRLLGKLWDGSDFRTTASAVDQRLLSVVEYIHKHYASAQAADVEYLASLAGISSTYLRRLFIKAYGIPTSTYVKNYRLNRAKALFDSGYYSVTEVAGRVGFDSPSYFAKEFRKYTGYTPRTFSRSEPIE